MYSTNKKNEPVTLHLYVATRNLMTFTRDVLLPCHTHYEAENHLIIIPMHHTQNTV